MSPQHLPPRAGSVWLCPDTCREKRTRYGPNRTRLVACPMCCGFTEPDTAERRHRLLALPAARLYRRTYARRWLDIARRYRDLA